jgi:prophage regulatory protein
MQQRIVRMKEASAIAGLSRAGLYRLMAAGKFIPSYKLAERAVGFKHSELMEWIDSRTTTKAL